MKITLTTLKHTHQHGQTITVHARDDDARDAIYQIVASSWSKLHCRVGLDCPVEGCTGVPVSIAHLTRDEAIEAYRGHVVDETFDREPHELDLDAAALLTNADNEALLAALSEIGFLGRDRLTAMIDTANARELSAQAVHGIRELLDQECAGQDIIGVTFTTWDEPEGGQAIHPEGTVLFGDGLIDKVLFGSNVTDVLTDLYRDVDGRDFIVTVDLRNGEIDGDDLNYRTIYDLFAVPELTMTPHEALRELRWARDSAESGDASSAEITAKFAAAFRALDISMTAGAQLPPQWTPRPRP